MHFSCVILYKIMLNPRKNNTYRVVDHFDCTVTMVEALDHYILDDLVVLQE
jgi:hypothetical protein